MHVFALCLQEISLISEICCDCNQVQGHGMNNAFWLGFVLVFGFWFLLKK